MANIRIVQGDDKHIKVKFIGDSATIVQGFYFTCATLGINKYFDQKTDDEWYINLSREETRDLDVGIHVFDITAKTISGDIVTGVYHGTVCVLKKDNMVE